MAYSVTMARPVYPIKYWSYSSLISYLRNPLAWYKRYVEHVYDTPSSPAAAIGRAGHVALEHFYGGLDKQASTALGLEYLRGIPDFEIEFGKRSRADMEREYLQAVGFYLARAPRHKVLGIEVSSLAIVPGLPLPIKAISDLVVESKGTPGAVDIVDHKFVDSFSPLKDDKPLFVLQAMFNYYTVKEKFNMPVRRFILQECRKRKNKDGSAQMRRYVLEYDKLEEERELFMRLVCDASEDIRTRKKFLPNPSDMFEGKNSFEVYRMNLQD